MWRRDTAILPAWACNWKPSAPAAPRWSMTVRADMVNGHHICRRHAVQPGDTAGLPARLQQRQPQHRRLGPARLIFWRRRTTTLIASAGEQAASGQTGVYDVSDAPQRRPVAGAVSRQSHRIRGEVIAGLQAAS